MPDGPYYAVPCDAVPRFRTPPPRRHPRPRPSRSTSCRRFRPRIRPPPPRRYPGAAPPCLAVTIDGPATFVPVSGPPQTSDGASTVPVPVRGGLRTSGGITVSCRSSTGDRALHGAPQIPDSIRRHSHASPRITASARPLVGASRPTVCAQAPNPPHVPPESQDTCKHLDHTHTHPCNTRTHASSPRTTDAIAYILISTETGPALDTSHPSDMRGACNAKEGSSTHGTALKAQTAERTRLRC